MKQVFGRPVSAREPHQNGRPERFGPDPEPGAGATRRSGVELKAREAPIHAVRAASRL